MKAIPKLEVLVIDDNSKNVKSISGLLQAISPKINISSAYSMDNATERLIEKPYDVAIIDFNMPGGDGLQTAKALRAISPTIKLIGCSTSWNDKNSTEAGLELYSAYGENFAKYFRQLIE